MHAPHDCQLVGPLGQFGEPGNTCIFRKKSDGSAVGNGYCPPEVPDGVSMGFPKHTGCYWGTQGSTRCADLRVRQVVTQSTTDIDTTKVNNGNPDQFHDWQLIRGDIAKSTYYPVDYPDWAGMNASDRVGIAFYSVIAAFIVGRTSRFWRRVAGAAASAFSISRR